MLDQRRILKLRSLPYEQYLKTPEWKQKRDEALERDGHRCRACNGSKKLEVHHRTYERRGNEDLNDLTTLCESCHELFHKKIGQDEIMLRTYQKPLVQISKERQSQKWEECLIGILIQHPHFYPYVCGIVSEDEFVTSDARTLYGLLGRASSSGLPFEQLVPSDLNSAVSRAVESISPKTPNERPIDIKVVMRLVAGITRERLMGKNKELQFLIEEAANAGDRAKEMALRQQVFENRKFLSTIYISTH
jgi:hypothetical protein